MSDTQSHFRASTLRFENDHFSRFPLFIPGPGSSNCLTQFICLRSFSRQKIVFLFIFFLYLNGIEPKKKNVKSDIRKQFGRPFWLMPLNGTRQLLCKAHFLRGETKKYAIKRLAKSKAKRRKTLTLKIAETTNSFSHTHVDRFYSVDYF